MSHCVVSHGRRVCRIVSVVCVVCVLCVCCVCVCVCVKRVVAWCVAFQVRGAKCDAKVMLERDA